MADIANPEKKYRPTSCAECRRKKLRCDRVFPCGSCRNKGCSDICPDGQLPPKKPKQVDVTVVEPLIKRIAELEGALASRQETSELHPLTLQQSLNITRTREEPSSGVSQHTSITTSLDNERSSDSDDVDKLTENIGILAMTGYGKSRFFGNIGRLSLLETKDSAPALFATAGALSTDGFDAETLDLPPQLLNISCAFLPTSNTFGESVGDWIERNLPPVEEAQALCESFFEHGAYIFVPLWRSMFMEEIFDFFYRGKREDNVEIPRGHRLALLLIIFGLGDLFDLKKPALPTGGKRFYHLARAALTTEAIYSHPTLTVVQTIMLLVLYVSLSDHKDANETIYILSGINIRLAYSLGLHREWRKFNVLDNTSDNRVENLPTAQEEELRRVISHEIVTFECWQALRFGRPSMINIEQFDCGSPGLYSYRDSVAETQDMENQAWGYRFLRDCLVPVLNRIVAVKPRKYSEILTLDKKIRGYEIPKQTQAFYDDPPKDQGGFSKAERMGNSGPSTLGDVLILILHRPYFAKAMKESSNDPLNSRFRASVLTIFHVSCVISRKIELVFGKEPDLSVRIWTFWDQLFGPCVILSSLVIKCPGCQLARTALAELDKIVSLLGRAKAGPRPSTLLPYALKLQEKAHISYNHYYSPSGTLQPTLAEFDISSDPIPLREGSLSFPNFGNQSLPPVSRPFVESGHPGASISRTSLSHAPNTGPYVQLQDFAETEDSLVPFYGEAAWTTQVHDPHHQQSYLAPSPAPPQTIPMSSPSLNHSNISITTFQPESQASDTTWQRDLEAMFTRPADYTFSAFGDGEPIAVDPGTQMNWHEFMVQMLQVPTDF